ncbi:hypothetical protein IMSHALPRED_003904 [Imshaugia aleurites]|uniref:Uncharacterized protein n=1 Tax=Imshaugia aleurites TaxID=172621 RepID=A0A8H3J8U2_9LECA|nr:hypothetical protein IMSHALPRED_003904 [Imshaugia aleurites]
MGHFQMRVEHAHRGLVTYGDNQDLRTRLEHDETRGVFKGDFDTMSEEYLEDSCQLLSIPSRGDRQSLINDIKRYNMYKRQKIDAPRGLVTYGDNQDLRTNGHGAGQDNKQEKVSTSLDTYNKTIKLLPAQRLTIKIRDEEFGDFGNGFGQSFSTGSTGNETNGGFVDRYNGMFGGGIYQDQAVDHSDGPCRI